MLLASLFFTTTLNYFTSIFSSALLYFFVLLNFINRYDNRAGRDTPSCWLKLVKSIDDRATDCLNMVEQVIEQKYMKVFFLFLTFLFFTSILHFFNFSFSPFFPFFSLFLHYPYFSFIVNIFLF